MGDANVSGLLLSWFSSYLSERHQFVALNGASSDLAAVSSGVPQGSILGPLLFILTFNDIFDLFLSSDSLLTGYADDVTYSKVVMNDADFGKVNSDLNVISDWLLGQNLSLNIGKVKCMLVSCKKSRSSPPVLINNQRIEQVSSFKLLGVTVTQDLSWSAHIGEICSKAKRTIGLLYRLFGKAGPTILGHLYKVFSQIYARPFFCYLGPQS